MWAGHLVRMFYNRTLQRILGKSPGRRSSAGKRRLRGKAKYGRIPPNRSVPKNWEQREYIGVIGGKKEGRLWPGNGPKSHRRRKTRSWKRKKKKTN